MGAGLPSKRGRALEELGELAPGLLAVGALLLLAAVDGGFKQTITYPVGLLLAGLLIVVLLVRRPRLDALGVPAAVGLGLLVAFAIWSFASIGWAGVRGIAFEAADRALIFVLIFALFALIPWKPHTATVAMAAYALGIGAIGVWAVLSAAGASDAALSFVNGRFAEPTNYANAAAALFVGAFWPAVFLASRSYVSWPLRGVLLAVAGLTLQIALLPQSRGAVYVFPIALLIYLIVAPLRVRTLIALAPVLAATALASGPILDVFQTGEEGGDIGAALASARDAMALSFLVLLGAGMLNGFVDSRLRVSDRVVRASRKGLGVATGGIVAAALIVAVAFGPFDWLGDRWEDFKGGYDVRELGDTRFSGDLGSNRYDFWRVAVEEQVDRAPVIGTGADNFAVDYIRERRSEEQPLFPHSLPLRTLGGLGLIGALLLAGAFVAMLIAAVRLRVRGGRDPAARGVAAVALASFAYWFLHSAGDWLWSFVAISGVVVAWLGVAAALEARRGDEPAPAPAASASGRSGPIPIVVAVLVGLLAVVALAPAWLSAREVSTAASSWGGDPDAAFARLDRARSLDPFSARPDLTAGAIASSLDDRGRARSAFAAALEREPTNWYALLELGALEALDGDVEAATVHLQQAAALNPRDRFIRTVMRRAQGPEPLTLQEINRRLLAEACSVVGPTHETRFCE